VTYKTAGFAEFPHLSVSVPTTVAHIQDMDSLNILILAGGHSSRMGSPKYLLPLHNGPLYLHLSRILHEALPETTTHHISLADRSVTDEVLRREEVEVPNITDAPSTITLKTIIDDTSLDIGPAAGLLAAHFYDPQATWVVIACDFPLLQATAIRQLVNSYEPPATCFKNKEGFSEPLLAIWSPQALESLKKNVDNGRSGPSYTLKTIDSKRIVPTNEDWLVNVNTKVEWDAIKTRIDGI
jgi:molybdopterin-guanine dinucleotide biosynthesis protein A